MGDGAKRSENVTVTSDSEIGEVRRRNPVVGVVRAMPFTLCFVVVLLLTSAITGIMFSPAADKPWFDAIATGLPAFEDGRWWTILTSPFFLSPPIVYLTLLPLVLGGFGWAEWRFGTLRMLAIALGGHIVGVLGAAGISAALASTGWHWGQKLASSLDVGPSCGAFAALVFAIATLPSPWRLRARAAVVLWAGISLLYLGQLYDLEHAIAIIAALIVAGLIPSFRHPSGRPTTREWRLIGFWSLIAVGAIEVINLAVPYDGPLGTHYPAFAVWDVVFDLVVIALITNGIRRGYRIAWIATITLGALNLLSAALSFITIPALLELGYINSPGEVLGQYIAPTVFWLAILIYVIVGRGAFRVPLRRSRRALATTTLNRDDMIERVKRFGGGTISWMTTWDENSRIAVGDGAIAYQAHSGVAIMLGDPIVPAGTHASALQSFTRITQQAGLIPCGFSTGDVTESAKPEGWRSIVVAEDTIVDLPNLAFTGKPWSHVRTAINRATRQGIEFRMVRLADEPWNILAQARAISEQWAGDKGLPEMRFTLGTIKEALDPDAYVGIAIDAEGNLHGVTSWLPVFDVTKADRVAGWTLDVMRRRDGGFGPVMEYLIASSAKHFSELGYDFISLSGAPLVRSNESGAGAVYQVLDQLGDLIEPLYGFRSLHKFKQKFNPRHESLHLLYRDEGDLPRIGIALTRAYLPDASMRDLVSTAASAGKDD
ncbi:bifunctional lysylphosphatidylglycerol flippase/synthetase MprF [Paramicrobacterium chengjingii]|uniref:bifunctional lysylphosphatidylglycerol flippase/synthetase MprF n=1 Tax=Paramicrobacterium chengjingii TaxID=2769067 RepID=UPI001423C149|nr:DUF2156 domain-containing protein [Microbacterium chengjingii]